MAWKSFAIWTALSGDNASKTRACKFVNHRAYRMHRVWFAEIRPTVATRTQYVNSETAAAERLLRDPLQASDIDRNELAKPTLSIKSSGIVRLPS